MADINSAVAVKDLPAVTGTFDITIPGFGTPKAAVFFLSNGQSDGTVADDSKLSIGFTDGTNHRVISAQDEDGVTTTANDRIAATDEVLQLLDTAGVILIEANFDSWITDGVRLNVGAESTAVTRRLTVWFFGGGDLTAFVGSKVLGNEDVTATVTGVGFEADALITICHGAIFNDTAGAFNVVSFGAVHNGASVIQRGISYGSNDAVAAQDLGGILHTNGCGGQTIWTGVTWRADVSNFGSDGFDITPRGGNSGGDELGFLALNIGTGSCKLDTYSTATSEGNDSVTGMGFEPQAVLLSTIKHQTVDDFQNGAPFEGFCIGVFDSSTERTTMVNVDEGETTTNTFSVADALCIDLDFGSGSGPFITASFVSLDSGGFTLNYSTVDVTARKGWYLAFEKNITGHIPLQRKRIKYEILHNRS